MAKKQDGNQRSVTLSELNDKLGRLRWEVRFLILLGMIGGQLVPAREAAEAALRLF